MEEYSWIDDALKILGGLIGGGTISGFITYLLTMKYIRKNADAESRKLGHEADQVKHQSEQAAQEVVSQQLTSTEKLIEMYTKGLDDIRRLNEEQDALVKEKIESLEKVIEELKTKNHDQALIIAKQEETIKFLSDSQKRLRERLDEMVADKCNNCEFKKRCLEQDSK